MSTERIELPERTSWWCPHCGYMVTDTQKKQAKVDFNCPRCEGAVLSEFVRLTTPADGA